MQLLRSLFGRYGRRRRASAALAVPFALGTLILAVSLIGSILPGVPVSKALAELVARSPGMRIGGTALKAKERRAQVSPGEQTPGTPAPRTALASVLGGSYGPETLDGLPEPDADVFPADFSAPPVPMEADVPPIETAVLRLPGIDNRTFRGPPVFVAPPRPNPPGGDLGRVTPIPEPQAWALMIFGFGLTGAALRSRRPRPALA